MTIDKAFASDMLVLTAKMLAAAQCNDWGALVHLESRRVQAIEIANARSFPDTILMDEASIRAVQVSDIETLRLVKIRMSEINDIFNASPLGRRLSRAYSDMADRA